MVTWSLVVIGEMMLKLHHLLVHRRCCHTLMFTNTFNRRKEPVVIGDQPLAIGSNPVPISRAVTVYACGPTVYDHCHLGHGLNFTRLDLLRRILTVYCHTPVLVAMGVTDIDDKIIQRARREGVDARTLADTFFDYFKSDLKNLNITPPHVYLRVTDHVQDIIEHIQQLESKGRAYVNEDTLDVVFDSSQTALFSDNHQIEENTDPELAVGKRSPRDFVLWKKSKEGEPSFDYESPSKQTMLPGRPGWHVECSALVHSFFGPQIDLHFGGKDLIFPHHYSEAACFHALCRGEGGSEEEGGGKDVTSWSSHWVHSGHLFYREDKMSKSLGNLVSISDFLKDHHFNIVRLMCIRFHYRSDLRFCKDLINLAVELDKNLKHLVYMVVSGIRQRGRHGSSSITSDIEKQIDMTRNAIHAGLADDLDMNRGLQEITNLYRLVRRHSHESLPAVLYCKILFLLQTWTCAMGLDYDLPPVLETVALASDLRNFDRSSRHLDMLIEVRRKVRALGLEYMKQKEKKRDAGELLAISDLIRLFLDEEGIKLLDIPAVVPSDSVPSSPRSSSNNN